MPYDKKPGAAVRMYDKKGKPAGLMLEGSMAHMQSMANYGSPNKKVGPGDPDIESNKENLIEKTVTKSREETASGIKGTRVTATSKYETPGGEVARTAEGDKAYAALTPEKRKAQDEKFLAKQRIESQTRFTPDAVKVPTTGVRSVKPEITSTMPKKRDTVIGGGDYKFDLSSKKPSYSIATETKKAFGSGTIGRQGQSMEDVERAIQKNKADKLSKTGSQNILKISDTSGAITGRTESEKAQYLLGKEREKELSTLGRAYSGIVNPTKEDAKNRMKAAQNITEKFRKLSSDIQSTYTRGSGTYGKEHRYSKRIKAGSSPMYKRNIKK